MLSDDERPVHPVKMLVLPFPMKNAMAQLVIPRNLTQAEADRLRAFVQSLVQPQPKEEGRQHD